MNGAGDIVHEILRQSNQQMQDMELAFDGHISTYDVATNMAKVIVPVLGVDDDGDNSSGGGQSSWETNWIPVAAPFVGNNFGIQYCFKGGATAENPAAGEPVIVIKQNRENGHMYCIPSNYNKQMVPPGAGISTGSNPTVAEDSNSNITDSSDAGQDVNGTAKQNPGELIIQLPATGSGSPNFVKFYEDSSFRTNVEMTMNVRVQQDLNVILKQGNMNVDVQTGDVNVLTEMGNINAEAKLGMINVTADVGTITALAKVGNIAALATAGNIEAVAAAGSITIQSGTTIDLVAGGTVTITAPGISLDSAIIDAGTGAIQALCNEAFLTWANSHTHISSSPGSATSAPISPAIPGVESTVCLKAS